MSSTAKLNCMISLARLELLLALHERGTLQAAAAALHISTSAASQQLATLTREAGAKLTEPDGRRLKLTEAGQVLAKHAYEIAAQLERARGDVQAAAAGELGTITVGGVASALPALLIPATKVTEKAHPRLRIDLREAELPDALSQLSVGDLDIVVVVENRNQSSRQDPRHERIPLGTDDFRLAVPRDSRWSRQQSVDLATLVDVDWISSTHDDSCDQLLHSACFAAGFTPRIRHRAADWLAMIALIEAGMGLALLPTSGASPMTQRVQLVPPAVQVKRHLSAVVRRGATSRPEISSYLTALQETARTLYDQPATL